MTNLREVTSGRAGQDETAPFPLEFEVVAPDAEFRQTPTPPPSALSRVAAPGVARGPSTLRSGKRGLRWKGMEVSLELQQYAARVARGERLEPYRGPLLEHAATDLGWDDLGGARSSPARRSSSRRTARRRSSSQARSSASGWSSWALAIALALTLLTTLAVLLATDGELSRVTSRAAAWVDSWMAGAPASPAARVERRQSPVPPEVAVSPTVDIAVASEPPSSESSFASPSPAPALLRPSPGRVLEPPPVAPPRRVRAAHPLPRRAVARKPASGTSSAPRQAAAPSASSLPVVAAAPAHRAPTGERPSAPPPARSEPATTAIPKTSPGQRMFLSDAPF